MIFTLIINFSLTVILFTYTPEARSQVNLLKGQTVYVPAYSHIYHGDKELPFYLTVTLSIRNTDQHNPITIQSVEYRNSEGKLIKHFTEKAVKLGALASTRYIVKESDKEGGSGASFIVAWKSDAKVAEPLIESIMISTYTQQGVSFTSRGQAIKENYE